MYVTVTFIIWLFNISILSVPDDGYSRNASCALNFISTFVLLSLDRYLYWWTISPRGYHHWVDTSTGGLLVPEGIITGSIPLLVDY